MPDRKHYVLDANVFIQAQTTASRRCAIHPTGPDHLERS